MQLDQVSAHAELWWLQLFSVEVKPGDAVVLGTDGLLDNVYPEETATIVSQIKARGDRPHVAASALAEFARMRAADGDHLSPFAFSARMHGLNCNGGKMDDITVVVAFVKQQGTESTARD